MPQALSSLTRSISPPTLPRKKARRDPPSPSITSSSHPPSTSRYDQTQPSSASTSANSPSLAAIEAGDAKFDDHLEYFAARLTRVVRCKEGEEERRLSIDEYSELFRRNSSLQGCHFVVHQHDHPVAGVHYDLRLQFSQSSSLSFALPYGLPGNPQSKRPTRMAVETRVHCLWNHLIESASHATGSLLIWDTGEYEVLDPLSTVTGDETDDSTSSSDAGDAMRTGATEMSQNERLIDAFQKSRITLRLHGTRLPRNYTINMWLPSANRMPRPRIKHSSSSSRPVRHRRNYHKLHRPGSSHSTANATPLTSSDSDAGTDIDAPDPQDDEKEVEEEKQHGDVYQSSPPSAAEAETSRMRTTNAYAGATNSINSIHSRQWYLSLNRALCGLSLSEARQRQGRAATTAQENENTFAPFVVRGPAVERSVVTGRLAADIMADEGVAAFVARSGWKPILN